MEVSALARLPPELRNQVYQHTFSSRFAVALQDDQIQHPLTRTCRQVRRESLQLYYSATRFNAYLRDGPITPLLQWLYIMGRKAVLTIQEIRVWDMHHNVLTLLSPSAGEALLALSESEGLTRTLPETSSPPIDNALDPTQRLELWSTLQDLKLGLRQLQEQRHGSSIVHNTSTYVLLDEGLQFGSKPEGFKQPQLFPATERCQ